MSLLATQECLTLLAPPQNAQPCTRTLIPQHETRNTKHETRNPNRRWHSSGDGVHRVLPAPPPPGLRANKRTSPLSRCQAVLV
ncbi:hypothetical protein T484DRAFT_1968234 [Baffinella frigidus]|nr:hypothetical protein T484DRAFT_1968234 [Cryptophyta sp. CCMP2293]